MLHFRGLHSLVTIVFSPSESPVIISAHRSLHEHENISIAANPTEPENLTKYIADNKITRTYVYCKKRRISHFMM